MSDKDIKWRADLVQGMHNIVVSLNNESAYYNHWIWIVPDGATYEDCEDIAEDEELFTDTVKCFKRIMAKYLDDGLYITGKVY